MPKYHWGRCVKSRTAAPPQPRRRRRQRRNRRQHDKAASRRMGRVRRKELPMRSHAALFLLMAVAFIGATAADKPKPIAIAEARALPLGTVVTVQGSVTLPSGAFKSSFDDEGFVLQDGTSGIYVSVKTNRGLKVGQRVQVTGKLAETNAQFRIIEADANSISA